MTAHCRKRVLVPGAGGPGAVNLTRSLRAAGDEVFTVGCDASKYYVFLAETDARALVPNCREADRYLEALNALIAAHSLEFVLPSNSVEAALLSARRDGVNARMLLPGPETIHTANSKWDSWRVWTRAGLPVPATFLLETPDSVREAFERIATRPVWVRGAGVPGKGVGVASLPCRTVDQALGWVDFHDGWGGMIASEFLPGDNLTWLGVWNQGRLVVSQARQRDAYVIPHVSPSGITGAPAVCHTVHRPGLNDLAVRATMAIDPAMSGPAFLDFKCDAQGSPRITEINAGRFGTTSFFYTAAGVNFPLALLRSAYGEDPEVPGQYDVLPPDLHWIRTLDCGPVLLTREEIERGPG